jgi:hypothetical protein
MNTIGENIWLLTYPLKKLGVDVQRNVTIIRLHSGQLVIHSTAAFASNDVAEISALGEPKWLVEAMLDHDTFADEARAAFPDAIYLAPPDFQEKVGFSVYPILPAPPAWGAELEVLAVGGIPSLQEYLFFHAPSRTLITADLVFNFGYDEPLWAELLLRVAIGSEHHPGMSRPFKAAIKDEAAFKSSMASMLAWDFDRVIVAHGEPIATGAKEKVAAMLRAAGF